MLSDRRRAETAEERADRLVAELIADQDDVFTNFDELFDLDRDARRRRRQLPLPLILAPPNRVLNLSESRAASQYLMDRSEFMRPSNPRFNESTNTEEDSIDRASRQVRVFISESDRACAEARARERRRIARDLPDEYAHIALNAPIMSTDYDDGDFMTSSSGSDDEMLLYEDVVKAIKTEEKDRKKEQTVARKDESKEKNGEPAPKVEVEELPPTFRWVHIEIV